MHPTTTHIHNTAITNLHARYMPALDPATVTNLDCVLICDCHDLAWSAEDVTEHPDMVACPLVDDYAVTTNR